MAIIIKSSVRGIELLILTGCSGLRIMNIKVMLMLRITNPEHPGNSEQQVTNPEHHVHLKWEAAFSLIFMVYVMNEVD